MLGTESDAGEREGDQIIHETVLTPARTEATYRTHRLTAALAVLMTSQSLLGLIFAEQYRDVEWIRATWYGNDWVTLAVAVPLLLMGRSVAQASSRRGLLLLLGATAYAAYNYAFYLFGAALNAFFPLYVAGIVLAAVTLITALPSADAGEIASRFHPRVPVRLLGGYFVFVGMGLSAVWVTIWAAYVFFGRPTPVEPDAFRLVAALDLSIMVPLLVSAGAMTWRHHTWGALLCGIAGVQAALYLLVLSANAILAVSRGLVESPGELPVWAPLLVLTAGATTMVIEGVKDSGRIVGIRAPGSWTGTRTTRRGPRFRFL